MKKIVSILLTVSLVTAAFLQFTFANDINNKEFPSEKFITLYTQLFEGDQDCILFDINDNIITESFVNDYMSYYKNNDFDTIMEVVSNNKLHLQHGSLERGTYSQSGNRTTYTVYTPWVYVLEPLDDLLSGKMAEFDFRFVGGYSVSNSQITSYYINSVQYDITDPGSLFPYVVTWNDISYGGGSYARILGRINVRYQFAYSNAVYQTISATSGQYVYP